MHLNGNRTAYLDVRLVSARVGSKDICQSAPSRTKLLIILEGGLKPKEVILSMDEMTHNIPDLIEKLSNTRSFSRIRRVSFLGVVDRVNQSIKGERPAFSRAEHSMGVFRLGFLAATHIGMSEGEAAHLFAACLVHDFGHPPFSHSLEYAFPKQMRQVGHHEILRDMLLSPVGYEQEVSRILRRHNLSPQRIFDIVDGNDPLSYFFLSPINIDTLDGIDRSMNSFGIFPSYKTEMLVKLTAEIYAGQVVEGNVWLQEMDRFWENKSLFYKILASENPLSLAERKFQKAVRRHIGHLERSHFSLTDDQFELRYPRVMREYDHDVGPEVVASRQEFVIDKSISKIDRRSVYDRYVRIKNGFGGTEAHAP